MTAPGPWTVAEAGGEERRFVAPDGTAVRYAVFAPDRADGAPPAARTLLLPGFTEFVEKYLETVEDLLARRHAVLCLDWRGQGLSDRPLADRERAHVRSMELFLSDLAGILAESGFLAGPGPFFVVGHSMGGHLALRALLELPLQADRAVVLAPMIDIPLGSFPPWFARLVSNAVVALGLGGRYCPGVGPYRDQPLGFEGNRLTGDARRYARNLEFIDRDPRLVLGGPTFGWLAAGLRSIDALNRPERLARIDTPILMLLAEREVVVSGAAQRWIADRLPNARPVEMPGARHEILSETDAIRAAAWAEIDRFLGAGR